MKGEVDIVQNQARSVCDCTLFVNDFFHVDCRQRGCCCKPVPCGQPDVCILGQILRGKRDNTNNSNDADNSNNADNTNNADYSNNADNTNNTNNTNYYNKPAGIILEQVLRQQLWKIYR